MRYRVVLAGTLTVAMAASAVLPSPAQAQPAAGQAAALAARPMPLPPLVNPPGDIPDSQAFVAYRLPQGFSLKAPEGWSRREQPDGVQFSDKYGSVTVQVTTAAAPPTIASARQVQAAALEASPMAVSITGIAAAALPGGPAIRIAFAVNSAPNPVTNKAIRLESEQYLFWRAGRLATVTLSAPLGADNFDQWLLMARSFAWN